MDDISASSTAKSFGRAATYGLSAILGNSVKHWATFIEWIESNGNIREKMVYGAFNNACKSELFPERSNKAI